MIHFVGEYESTMDAKGRFLLPAKLLSQLPQGAATNFIINRGLDECLYMYPAENWETVSAEVENLPDYEEDYRKLKRFFNAGVQPVSPDSANGVLVGQLLKSYAKLEKDIVLTCSRKRIEIWDKSKYQEFFETFTAADYSALYKKALKENKTP